MKEKLEKIKAQLCASNPIENALLIAIDTLWIIKRTTPHLDTGEDAESTLQEIINQFED